MIYLIKKSQFCPHLHLLNQQQFAIFQKSSLGSVLIKRRIQSQCKVISEIFFLSFCLITSYAKCNPDDFLIASGQRPQPYYYTFRQVNNSTEPFSMDLLMSTLFKSIEFFSKLLLLILSVVNGPP